MARFSKIILISTLLIISVIISGCYTIIGHPIEEAGCIIEKDADKVPIYNEYGYYYPGYLGDDYDLDYLFNPFFNYYHRYPLWYDDSYYYWYDNYYLAPIPQKKPEIKKRDASEFRRSRESEQPKDRSSDGDKTQEKSKRESPKKLQKDIRKHRGSESKSSQKEEKE